MCQESKIGSIILCKNEGCQTRIETLEERENDRLYLSKGGKVGSKERREEEYGKAAVLSNQVVKVRKQAHNGGQNTARNSGQNPEYGQAAMFGVRNIQQGLADLRAGFVSETLRYGNEFRELVRELGPEMALETAKKLFPRRIMRILSVRNSSGDIIPSESLFGEIVWEEFSESSGDRIPQKDVEEFAALFNKKFSHSDHTEFKKARTRSEKADRITIRGTVMTPSSVVQKNHDGSLSCSEKDSGLLHPVADLDLPPNSPGLPVFTDRTKVLEQRRKNLPATKGKGSYTNAAGFPTREGKMFLVVRNYCQRCLRFKQEPLVKSNLMSGYVCQTCHNNMEG